MANQPTPYRAHGGSSSLGELLERVLDKGVVIVGDIVVSVLDIELLSLKLRLFIASAETARELGMDWWTRDAFFSSAGHRLTGRDGDHSLQDENEELRHRVAALEQAVRQQALDAPAPPVREAQPREAAQPQRERAPLPRPPLPQRERGSRE
jgi:hypothetical protein